MWNLSRIDDAFIPCVYGDFVAVATVVYFISVWNWKTGQLVSEQVRILTNPKCDPSNNPLYKSSRTFTSRHLIF